MRHFGISSVVAAVLKSCALPGEAEVSFLDRAALPAHQSYEGEWNHYVGGGVAVLDCNDDGLPDFYAAGGSAPSRLFVNTSRAAATSPLPNSPIAALSEVTGAYPMDVDGDDILDLIVLRDGPNVLLRGSRGLPFWRRPRRMGL